MATIPLPKIYLNFETSLAAKMSDSASSFTLNVSVDDDGTALSGRYLITIDEGQSTEEHIIATIAGSTATVVTRGLSRVDAFTNVAGNQKAHDRGASVKITNAALVSLVRLLNGDDTFNAVNLLGINSISDLALPTSGELDKAATVEFVVNSTTAGATDASEVGKGIVEVGTQVEIEAGAADGSGSTTAPIVMTAAKFLETWDKQVTTDYEYANTISVGDVLYLNPSTGKWELAFSASAASSDSSFGVALDAGVFGNTGKRVQLSGVVTGLSGLTAGIQYISGTGGALIATAGTYKKVFGFAPNATTLIIWPQGRVEDLAGTNSVTNTANLNEAMTFFNTTAITGANATSLIDGSDASSLHSHPSENGTITGSTIATATTTDFSVTGLTNQPNEISISGSIQANGSGGTTANVAERFTATFITTGNPDVGLSATVTISGTAQPLTVIGFDGATQLVVQGVGTNIGRIVLTLNSIEADGFTIRAVTTVVSGTYENCIVSDLGFITRQ